jgi:GT2 family glycosyltransferase
MRSPDSCHLGSDVRRPAAAPEERAIEISFVVPAHNEEARLPAALVAIQAEIARLDCSAEVIVVDNASLDRTAAVAAAFSGVRVVAEPVKGLARARQAGFLASGGALVANIDADTILPEGWLRRVLDEFRRDPGLVGLSGPYVYYDLPRHTRAVVRVFYWLGYAAYLLNRHVLRTGSMMQGGNFVVAREALERIGGFDPAFTFYGEDTDTARRLHAVGGVKFTFGLPAFSSGRRLTGEGVFATGIRYGMNYLWANLRHRPFTRESRDHRA